MFDWYDAIKRYYDLGVYTDEQVNTFVSAGWITRAQADEITHKNEVTV